MPETTFTWPLPEDVEKLPRVQCFDLFYLVFKWQQGCMCVPCSCCKEQHRPKLKMPRSTPNLAGLVLSELNRLRELRVLVHKCRITVWLDSFARKGRWCA